jgi:hypothetical protein
MVSSLGFAALKYYYTMRRWFDPRWMKNVRPEYRIGIIWVATDLY